MRLPVEWITEYVPVEAVPDEIAHRLTMAGLEVEERDESERGPVLNITVTPNRGDCLSVLGVARELSAAYNMPLRVPDAPRSYGPGDAAQAASVTIEAPDLCPRYAARIIRDVKRRQSPPWMQQRLEAAGMRPIDAMVDVTNYVMLETGQPLHAFDLARLHGSRIVVRRARPGEALTTLDGVERALAPEMLVIADAERPVALAGVMGGAATEVTARTSTVLLESAHFHWLTVRRTARALGMRTEASDRFARVVDPALVALAADRACRLIAELGIGDVVPGILDVYPAPAALRVLEVRPARVSTLLGFEVSADEVVDCLSRLGFSVTDRAAGITVAVPSWRPDIVREVDLVEEVGRVLGYERIPERLPTGATTHGGDSAPARFAERLRNTLAGAGLQEIVSHSLLAPGPFEDPREESRRVAIRSALSAELSGLRASLLPGLLDAVEHNARRLPRDQAHLALFEVGNVFAQEDRDGEVVYSERSEVAAALTGPVAPPAWSKAVRQPPADYYLARGLVERIASDLNLQSEGSEVATGSPFAFRPMLSQDPRLHPGRSADVWLGERYIGIVGQLHPRLAADLTARDPVVVFSLDADALREAAERPRGFRPLTPYPVVTRDLAPRVAADVPYSCVADAIVRTPPAVLEDFRLTDLFTGAPLPEGVKSLTLSFRFRASDRTLTDAEVNDALEAIRSALEASCGATFPA